MIQEISLEVLRRQAQYALDRNSIAATPPEVSARLIEDGVVFAIGQLLAGQRLEQIDCEWPADWWQAVKLRWFPMPALARWPVRMERRSLRSDALYPDIPIPRGQRRVVVLEMSRWQDRGPAR